MASTFAPENDGIVSETKPEVEVSEKPSKSTFVDDPADLPEAVDARDGDEGDDDAPDFEEQVEKPKRSKRAEAPEYDPIAARARLSAFGQEAVQYEMQGEMARINAELQRLPRAPRTEEEFLSMTEQQKFALTQAETRRQQLLHYRDNILPHGARARAAEYQQMSDQIVSVQQSFLRDNPKDGYEVLSIINSMANDPNAGISARELANPAFYSLVRNNHEGQKAYQRRMAREKLSSAAGRASVAGRGGAQAPAKESPLPPDSVKKLRSMGLNDDQIKRTISRQR